MKSKEKVEIELLKEMTYTEINNLLRSRNKQISYLQKKNEELVKKFSISSVLKPFNACFKVGDKVTFKTVKGVICKDLGGDFFGIRDNVDNYIWQAHKDSIKLETKSV